MHTPFSVGSIYPLNAQPTIGSSLYARSTSDTDAIAVAVTGKESSSAVTDGGTLNGKIELAINGYEFSKVSFFSLASAAEGDVELYQFGVAATGELRLETNPVDGTTITFGLAGNTQAYRLKDTLASAYDVKIGADATETMLNFKKALNADGITGTNYYTGTLVNPFASGAVSGTILTMTDRIACNRQLGWSFAQSSTHFSLPSTLSGGVDGTLIASLNSGTTQTYDPFSFDTEDLTIETLPGLLIPTTDWVSLNGKSCELQFKCENVGTAIPFKYQTSTDQVNASDGLTAITSLDNNTVASPLRVTPAEPCIEFIRLVGTDNVNATDSKIDARVIYPS